MPATKPERRTAVFAKLPVAGAVKTRLSPPLAPEEAARLAEAMLADALGRCLARPELSIALRYAPASAGSWFRQHFPSVRDQEPQRGAGLAERLAAHFDDEALRSRGGGAVVLGADAPLLPASEIVRAHELLEEGAELVLAPDQGGGYALVGLSGSHSALFGEVAMSTARNFERTLAVARAAGLAVALLAPTLDVDVEADLRALARAFAERPSEATLLAPRTARLLAGLSISADSPRGTR